jgi:hypothetical protein
MADFYEKNNLLHTGFLSGLLFAAWRGGMWVASFCDI